MRDILSKFDEFKTMGHSDHNAQRNATAEYARTKRMSPDKAATLLREAQRARKQGNKLDL